MSRNAGIELLRIVAMFMVCLLHVLGRGGALVASKRAGSRAYRMALLIEIGSYCSVNCYGLILGYVHAHSRPRLSRAIYLWLQVMFLSMTIELLNWYLPEGLFQWLHLKRKRSYKWWSALAPISQRLFWYFDSFLGTLIISLRVDLRENVTKQGLLLFIFFFSVLPHWTERDLFRTEGGYSMVWIFLLYCFGGGLKAMLARSASSKWVFGAAYITFIVLTYAEQLGHFSCYHLCRLNYTSPSIFGSAIALLSFFESLTLPDWGKRLVLQLSPLTFGVYILHSHPLTYGYLHNHFAYLGQYTAGRYILSVLYSTCVIVFFCSMIDKIRLELFKLIRIPQIIQNFDKIEL